MTDFHFTVKKKMVLESMTNLKGDYQFYCDARTFLWLYRIKPCNDVMKFIRIETLFLIINKKLKKGGVRFPSHSAV